MKNLVLTSNGRSPAYIKDFVKTYWSDFDIDLNKFPNQLSAGQKQIINLLRIFIFEPDIILLDEPTEHLDTRAKFLFLDYYIKNKSDKTCIWVSHNDGEISKIADEIIDLSSDF